MQLARHDWHDGFNTSVRDAASTDLSPCMMVGWGKLERPSIVLSLLIPIVVSVKDRFSFCVSSTESPPYEGRRREERMLRPGKDEPEPCRIGTPSRSGWP